MEWEHRVRELKWEVVGLQVKLEMQKREIDNLMDLHASDKAFLARAIKVHNEDHATIQMYMERYERDQKLLARSAEVHDEKNKLIDKLMEIGAIAGSDIEMCMIKARSRMADRTGPTVTER